MRYVKFIDIISTNLIIYKNIFRLFKFKKISDFRKEKLLFNYSKLLLITSLKIFSLIISMFVFAFILTLFSNSLFDLFISIFGIAEVSIFFIFYHLLRKNIDAKL